MQGINCSELGKKGIFLEHPVDFCFHKSLLPWQLNKKWKVMRILILAVVQHSGIVEQTEYMKDYASYQSRIFCWLTSRK